MKLLVSALALGTASAAINLSEVESHAAKDDCWLSIEGKVFDVTSWMPKHPGGAAILFRQCGKVADKSFNAVHAARGLAALRVISGDLVKEVGALDAADAEQAKNRKASTRNRDFKTDETNLSPFAKVALHAVEQHPIVVKNQYTEWFADGSASVSQMKDLIVEFSVFSNLFLQAQLRKVLNAPSLHEMREGKEILANELGVVFNNDHGKGRRDGQEGVGGDFDPDLVSTEGTVEGGYYSHRAAHFEWLLDVGKSMGIEFADMGKRKHGSNETLFFCDQMYNLYGSDDLSVSLGASFAVEHWANAGFWDDLVDGFSVINEKNVLGKSTPLGFWLFHQALEGQHAAHTMDELEEAIEGNRIADRERFLKAANEVLDAVGVFWNGLHNSRVSLGSGLKGEL